VTVSEPLARDLQTLHPDHRVATILNGFDPELVNPGEELTSELTITHTGTLHQGRRDPTMLLEAVRDLLAAGAIDRDRLRIRLYCRHEPWLDALVAGHGLDDVVELPSWTDQESVVRAQRRSQVLLLLHWGGVREEGVYTAKVFEYLAARRPILLIGGSRGVLARLIEETGAGVHVHRPDHLREVLRGLWGEYRSTGSVAWRGRPETIERYSQVRMAEDYASLLEAVSRRRTP
jgi:glycosyltransferase involved in cell wall biosynthesis